MKLSKYVIGGSYLFFCLGISVQISAQTLTYHLYFPEPHTHYVEVQFDIVGNKQDSLDFKMPTWTPGSYLIREFAKNVESVKVTADDIPATLKKINKNTWRVYAKKKNKVSLKYSVYAFEWSVRTSIVDDTHAHLNGTSVFMFVKGLDYLPVKVNINPYQKWEKISTQLPLEGHNPWVRTAPDYDFLADSPIEIGNHQVIQFDAGGIPHEFAIYGLHTFDVKRLVEDTKKIIDQAVKVFGVNPCPNYTFIVQSGQNLSGGLEHLNSTTVMADRFTGANEASYINFLGLLAHEYFHLWNVKRLRPTALGPFDYDNENYTRMLWVVEGFTSYYDDLLCYRAGILSQDFYLQKVIVQHIQSVVCTPGDSIQSLAESSLDTWIKFYRRNENTKNSQVHYYQKGSVVASLLDIEIIRSSNGKYNLDTLMARLYRHFFMKGKTYSDTDFQRATEELAGKSLKEFWDKYIDGTHPIPYNDYFHSLGLQLTQEYPKVSPIGLTYEERNNRLYIKEIERSSPAWRYGLNVQDELLAINGFRIESKQFWDSYTATFTQNENISLLINRYGIIRTIPLVLSDYAGCPTIRLISENNPTPDQQRLYQLWLNTK